MSSDGPSLMASVLSLEAIPSIVTVQPASGPTSDPSMVNSDLVVTRNWNHPFADLAALRGEGGSAGAASATMALRTLSAVWPSIRLASA